MKQIIEKKNKLGRGLIICGWIEADGWLERSCILHQREFCCFIGRWSYDLFLIENYKDPTFDSKLNKCIVCIDELLTQDHKEVFIHFQWTFHLKLKPRLKFSNSKTRKWKFRVLCFQSLRSSATNCLSVFQSNKFYILLV